MPLHLVTYDIACPKRLRRVARLCEEFGQRVQESVFLVDLEATELRQLMLRIGQRIQPAEDSVRYLPVCSEDLRGSRGQGLCNGLQTPPGCWVV